MTISLNSFNAPINVALFGAAGGIGSACRHILEKHPAVETVYAISRTAVAPSDHVIPLAADFTNEQDLVQISQAIQKPLHLCFVSSGFLHNDQIKPEKSLAKITAESLKINFERNTLAPTLIAKHMIPKLHRDGKSCFAALSARVGSISDNQLGGWHSYRTSKAALNMLIKTISIETSRRLPQSVIVGLHPGTVNTPLSEPFQRNVPQGKLFTAEYSASRLLDVINNLTPSHTGKCFDYAGIEIPA